MASPDNFDTLSKLQAPSNPVESLSSGLDTGIKLATMSDNVQQKRAQTEAMQDELAGKKFDQFVKMQQTYLRSSDKVRQMILPQLEAQARRMDIGASRDTFKAIGDDPTMFKAFQDIAKLHQGGQLSPEDMNNVLAHANDLGLLPDTMTQLSANNKLEKAKDLAETRAAAVVSAAATKATEHKSEFDQRMDNAAEGKHQAILRNAIKDPLVKQQVTQYNNLQNAMNNFKSADFHTPQQFDELQQAVRSNLGIKGQTGINEREKTTLGSLGIDAGKFTQWLSGKPISIEDMGGQAFVDHVMQLAELESGNIQKQADIRLKAALAGHKDFYSKHPGLLEDATAFADAQNAQVGGAPAAVASGTTQPAPTGIDVGGGKMIDPSRGTLQQFKQHYPNVTVTPEQEKLFKQ